MFMSENVTGAGNQQGRPVEQLGNYIAGFVDGEGSFHIAVHRHPTVKCGWQMIPEFHVSQRGESKIVLDLIRETLQCGYVKENHRTNPRDTTWVYVVRAHQDLMNKVIPFFERFSLRTAKQFDFLKFSQVVNGIAVGKHKSREGFEELLQIAFSMNCSGAYRKRSIKEILDSLEPSETVRRTLL
jgi:hypothetical protein